MFLLYDVLALGELLIDFTPMGKSDRVTLYSSAPAARPPMSYCLAKRVRAPKPSAVGEDDFGRFCKSLIERAFTEGLVMDPRSIPPWPSSTSKEMESGPLASTAALVRIPG